MKRREIETRSAKETGEAAAQFAAQALGAEKGKGARVVCLWGDLGSGKTTFVQGAAVAAGVREIVNSPTFLIMKKYLLPGSFRGRELYHFDCYRVQSAGEVLDLGWEEILAGSGNLVFVEWPERIREILPAERTDLFFESLDADRRRIVFEERAQGKGAAPVPSVRGIN